MNLFEAMQDNLVRPDNLRLILDANPPGVGRISPQVLSNWHETSRRSARESLPTMIAQYVRILDILFDEAGARGMTRGELEDRTGLTHQTLTSRVNGLERVGLVATLLGVSRYYGATRRRQKVVVHCRQVNGRPVEPFRSRAEEKDQEIERLRALCLANGINPDRATA